MEWLAFLFALELGAIRGSEIPVDMSSYVQMEATAVAFGHLEIGGALRSYQIPYKEYQWWTLRMDYTVSATVRFGGFSFGAEHMCYHPVAPFGRVKYEPVFGWEERLFIRIATPRP